MYLLPTYSTSLSGMQLIRYFLFVVLSLGRPNIIFAGCYYWPNHEAIANVVDQGVQIGMPKNDENGPDLNQPDPNKPHSNQPDSNKLHSGQPDPNQPHSDQPDLDQPSLPLTIEAPERENCECNIVGSQDHEAIANVVDQGEQIGMPKNDENGPDLNQPDPNKPHSNQPDPNKLHSGQPDPNQPHSDQPDLDQPSLPLTIEAPERENCECNIVGSQVVLTPPSDTRGYIENGPLPKDTKVPLYRITLHPNQERKVVEVKVEYRNSQYHCTIMFDIDASGAVDNPETIYFLNTVSLVADTGESANTPSEVIYLGWKDFHDSNLVYKYCKKSCTDQVTGMNSNCISIRLPAGKGADRMSTEQLFEFEKLIKQNSRKSINNNVTTTDETCSNQKDLYGVFFKSK